MGDSPQRHRGTKLGQGGRRVEIPASFYLFSVSRRLCGRIVFFARKTVIFVSLALIGLLAANVARASQGFVVEANRATLEVGAAIEASTPIAVEAGGHIVVMTSAARMIRREGPFEGDGADFLDAAAPGVRPLATKLLLALLELVKTPSKSEETALGTRDIDLEDFSYDRERYAIRPNPGFFCIHDNQPPAFFTADPPASVTTLVMRRMTRPKQLLRTDWPAGNQRLDWPEGWPSPISGVYYVSIGNSDEWAVRLVSVGPRLNNPLRQAALYYEANCKRQATVALRVAIAATE